MISSVYTSLAPASSCEAPGQTSPRPLWVTRCSASNPDPIAWMTSMNASPTKYIILYEAICRQVTRWIPPFAQPPSTTKTEPKGWGNRRGTYRALRYHAPSLRPQSAGSGIDIAPHIAPPWGRDFLGTVGFNVNGLAWRSKDITSVQGGLTYGEVWKQTHAHTCLLTWLRCHVQIQAHILHAQRMFWTCKHGRDNHHQIRRHVGGSIEEGKSHYR